jgi:CxxC motif-containing protein
MEGNECDRGKEYARNEYFHPKRILTTVVKVSGADVPLVPVRSDKPLPKELLLQCMDLLKAITLEAPVSRYDVIIKDILGTGANIRATNSARSQSR